MTYLQMKNKLKAAGIDSPPDELAILISHFCGKSRESILADGVSCDYSDAELAAAIDKRCEHIPLQYIIGEWEFFGCRFKVNESCLIPRYDTEVSVEKALEILSGKQNLLIADLCTGSGCIAISLLSKLKAAKVVALEKYSKTLDTAVENAKLNSVGDRFVPVLADVFDGTLPNGVGGYDMIISNPPYIPTDVIPTLSDDVRHEPITALDGGRDGMDFYRFIVPAYKKYLKPDGVFVFEIGYDQGDLIRDVARKNFCDCMVYRDLNGQERTAVLSHIM